MYIQRCSMWLGDRQKPYKNFYLNLRNIPDFGRDLEHRKDRLLFVV
jgi:hypothetical protein